MIYVGNSETFTPAHKDVCGALGHNLMVYSDNGRTHAIWCIMKYEDLEQIRIFFQQNGAFLDDDNCFLPLHILSKAPFTVYLFEQKLGDLVLLPPSAPHQVLNMGGKASRSLGIPCLVLPYLILTKYWTNIESSERIKCIESKQSHITPCSSILKRLNRSQNLRTLDLLKTNENDFQMICLYYLGFLTIYCLRNRLNPTFLMMSYM